MESYYSDDDDVNLDGGLDQHLDEEFTEEELLARYRQQLMFYKTAVARTLQKPVHAVYLYSFCLSKPCEYK